MRNIPIFILVVVLSGCGKPAPELHPVTGRVVYKDGTPMSAGTVRLVPKSGSPDEMAIGKLDSDGRFTAMTDSKPGAAAGEYEAIVVPALGASPDEIGRMKGKEKESHEARQRWATPLATKRWTFTVAAGAEKNHFDISLDLPPPPPASGDSSLGAR